MGRQLTYVLNSKADFILTREQIKLGQYHDPVQWAAFPLIDAVCARLQYVVIVNADFGKTGPRNGAPGGAR